MLEVAVSLQKFRQQLLKPIVSGCKKSKTTLLIEKMIYEARLVAVPEPNDSTIGFFT